MRASRLVVSLVVAALSAVTLAAVQQPAPQQSATPRPACAMPQLPPVSREQNLFTPEQASMLGDIVMEHASREFALVGDAALNEHLQGIVDRMAAIAGLANVRVALIDLPDANAMTLPGGRVLVVRKLVAVARSEDEIAGVVAHEVGHIVNRDAERDVSALLRRALKVTSVGDRADIAEKYNRLLEARRRGSDVRSDRESDKEQQAADTVGMWLMARAGYTPQAYLDLFNRLAELHSKTGNWLSDFFGVTPPDAKRLRVALQAAASLPAECIAPRATTAAEFGSWQQRVLEAGRTVATTALHGVLAERRLEPALRSDLAHLRFSPDGKWILAQDDANVYLFSRDPLAFAFRLDAPDAYPAQFSPDSGSVVFYDENYRVERWNLGSKTREWVHEVMLNKGCLDSTLSPDGTYLACATPDLDLRIVDVATGTTAFEKKNLYEVMTLGDAFSLLVAGLEGADRSRPPFFQMHFSPDGHYFVIARSLTSLALDMSRRAPIPLPGAIRDRLGRSFSFLGSDRIVGIHVQDGQKSAIVTFPQGVVQATLRLGNQAVTAATRGDRYVMLRGIKGYDVTVFDVAQGKVILGNTAPGFDVYDDMFIGERKSGALGVYRVRDNAPIAVVEVPNGPLGRLRAADVSPDFGLLAISQTTRGGAWTMSDGQRRMYTRGFRAVHVESGAGAIADFPKTGRTPRAIARLDAATGHIVPLVKIDRPKEDQASGKGTPAEQMDALNVAATVVGTEFVQGGRFLYGWRETNKSEPPTLGVYEASTGKELWTRPFRKGAPQATAQPHHDTLLLYWAYASDGARPVLDANPGLKTQFAASKAKKEDAWVIELVELATGRSRGHVLVDLAAEGSRVRPLAAIGDHFICNDGHNRTLVYSIATGKQIGHAFGAALDVTKAGSIVAIQNNRGELTLHSVPQLEKLDELRFPSEVAFARFSDDGTRLFVLTVDQTAYTLSVSGAEPKPGR